MLKRGSLGWKLVCLFVVVVLTATVVVLDLTKIRNTEAALPGLPVPGTLLMPSAASCLPVFKGIRLDLQNPFDLEFLVDSGDDPAVTETEASRLISYFLAGLTTPDEDLWVNLSPYEENRVLAEGLESTDLGRDLVAQDYVLKQLASSLTHPDTKTGAAYWAGVGANNHSPLQADASLSKIWIVPDIAEVYEQGTTAVITEASLKLQCEDESQQILLPAITKDVNEGKNFAKLRQI